MGSPGPDLGGNSGGDSNSNSDNSSADNGGAPVEPVIGDGADTTGERSQDSEGGEGSDDVGQVNPAPAPDAAAPAEGGPSSPAPSNPDE